MMQMAQVKVALGDTSYEIVVGEGAFEQAGALLKPLLPGKRVFVLSDVNVSVLYGARIQSSLEKAGFISRMFLVPAGEGSKSFEHYQHLLEQMLAEGPDRKTTILALGGGVVGDLAGFIASTLLRGVPFVQVPTSLLAQVDSSVGGKTAINATHGKNLIGSFYQPKLVIADTGVLKTLPGREIRAGYAEIIKYGLIMDEAFYRWCLANGHGVVAGDASAQQRAIVASCQFKAEVVKADEREANRRAILNFGHTFAHALEAETGFSDVLLHGEAVAIGMVMACRLSAKLGILDAAVEAELAGHLKQLGMKSYPKEVSVEWDVARIVAHFSEDKKAEDGKLTFVALSGVGNAVVVKDVSPQLVQEVVVSYL